MRWPPTGGDSHSKRPMSMDRLPSCLRQVDMTNQIFTLVGRLTGTTPKVFPVHGGALCTP